MSGPRWRAAVLAMTGLVVVVLLGLAAGSGAFPPPPPGEAVVIVAPPPQGPAQEADEGQVDDAGGGGRGNGDNRFTGGFAWYEWVMLSLVLTFAVCLLVAPLVVLGLIRLPGRPRRGPTTSGQLREPGELAVQLARAVDEALEQVEHGPTREAVVACWLLLERAATAAGSPAAAHETTTEYASRLAAQQLVSGPALTTLAALYREVRFSDHPVSAQMRERARAALGVLQGELTGSVRL